MQAIVTKYLGPTDFKGARVKATCQAKSITRAWNDALDVDQNHDLCAQRLADELEWLNNGDKLVGGGLPDGTGNCYVIVRKADR